MMRLRRIQVARVCFHSRSSRYSSSSSSSSSENRKRVSMQSVHRTLRRCPSDLIALSFFLWSAQHHHHHHRHHSCSFDHMATLLHRLTRRYKSIPALLSELHTIGCPSLTNPNSSLLLLRIFRRAGMYTMFLQAYHHLYTAYAFVPDTFAHNLLMDVLFRIGKHHLALSLLLNHIHPPNFFTFNIALFHLSNLSHFPQVPYVLRLMLRTGYYPSPVVLHKLLNSLTNINVSYQLLGLMITLGIDISVRVWTILIHKYCKLGRLDVATCLLDNMAQSGSPPNLVTYTILFKAFMDSQMEAHAFRLLNIMLSDHIPDLILSNVLIHCLSKAGKYRDAFRVFVSFHEHNIEPDSYTFTSLLSTICLSRMFYLLPKLVSVSRYIDADLVFCNALLSSLIKAQRPSLAVGFYDHMLDEGFVPDKYSFAGLLGALCAMGRIDEAVNVYRGVLMSYNDIDAHIHTLITDELVKVGKYREAASVFKSAVKNKYALDNVAYTVGICALLRDGRTHEACTLYDRMKDNGLKPSVHTCKRRDLQMMSKMKKRKQKKWESLNYQCFQVPLSRRHPLHHV